MFSDEDYLSYFDELENRLKKSLIICTDILNEVKDSSLRSKLFPLVSENFETYKLLKKEKEKFKKETSVSDDRES